MLNATAVAGRIGKGRFLAVVVWCGVIGVSPLAGSASPLPEVEPQSWQVAGGASVSPLGMTPFCKVSRTAAEIASVLLASGEPVASDIGSAHRPSLRPGLPMCERPGTPSVRSGFVPNRSPAPPRAA